MLLKIGDKNNWRFSHGEWNDGEDGKLLPINKPDENAEEGLQGYRFAFFIEKSFENTKTTFQFLQDGHCDVGLIFRAISKNDFYLLHFPRCRQASRAQNFWAAVSKMDESGYLRLIDLKLVHSVDANKIKRFYDIEVEICGDRLIAKIDKRGCFEVNGLGSGAGCMGVAAFNASVIKNVHIEGCEKNINGWNDLAEQPTNWFHPCSNTEYGLWHQVGSLLRGSSGDLIQFFSVVAKGSELAGSRTNLVIRSSDNGKTWSDPEKVIDMQGSAHIFPDGKMRAAGFINDSFYIYESPDEGITWSEPKKVDLGPIPPIKRAYSPSSALTGRPLLNLSNGTVLQFTYFYVEWAIGTLETLGHDCFTWGNFLTQTYSSFTRDNGMTWSPFVNVDGCVDEQGIPANGNLDINEISAVELDDGRIIAILRADHSPWMWETWSLDHGVSWTPCMHGQFPGYAASNLLKTSSGYLVIAHRLPGLAVNISFDDGVTWDKGTVIDTGIWAMGSMIEILPDIILYVYMDSFETQMRAQLMHVTKKGIIPVKRDCI